MNHRIARIVIACVAMLTIWQHHGSGTWTWIAFFVLLMFVGAGDRTFPHMRISDMLDELKEIYADDIRRISEWKH